MKEYDVIVIGSGAGAMIAENALAHGLSTAFVDKGSFGGTCLNVGCIPSKMLLYPADRVMEINDGARLGVEAEIKKRDFGAVMERTRRVVARGEAHMRKGISGVEGLDVYEGLGSFVRDYTLEVNGEAIRGERIVIASGARPDIPPIEGIEEVDYLTNESLLQLRERPTSLMIIGGGYIAAEYAHFFDAMGTEVTLIQRNERLVPDEEPEISGLLKTAFSRRMKVYTGAEVTKVRRGDGGHTAVCRETTSNREFECTAEKVLIAAGRRSNADILKVGNTGVHTDERGYIETDDYLQTTRKNIWACGDALGRKMFRHVANKEASVVWHNAFHKTKEKMDYAAAPHAVFSYPEIASVGMTEEEARSRFRKHDIMVGRAGYSDVARGEAMMEEEGFAKAIVRREDEKVLGFHIIGPHASILIQEVVNAMANDLDMWSIGRGMHIHPALPELIIAALGSLEEIE